MAFLFAPPTLPSLPILGHDARLPVRRIYCVGRNFAAHAVEMGADPEREPPFFFQKNPDDLFLERVWPYPAGSAEVHHEVEMVAALGSGGTDIPAADALDHVFGYATGLDMTRRDLQAEAKRLGRPWEVGKAFAHSAPCGPITPAAAIGHPSRGAVRLTVNGDLRQEGDLDQLIWKLPEIIAHLSALFTLAPGDLIFTGTPAGVGPVHRGDQLAGYVDGLTPLEIEVA